MTHSCLTASLHVLLLIHRSVFLAVSGSSKHAKVCYMHAWFLNVLSVILFSMAVQFNCPFATRFSIFTTLTHCESRSLKGRQSNHWSKNPDVFVASSIGICKLSWATCSSSYNKITFHTDQGILVTHQNYSLHRYLYPVWPCIVECMYDTDHIYLRSTKLPFPCNPHVMRNLNNSSVLIAGSCTVCV